MMSSPHEPPREEWYQDKNPLFALSLFFLASDLKDPTEDLNIDCVYPFQRVCAEQTVVSSNLLQNRLV